MATGGQKELACGLVNVGVLTLEEAHKSPWYISIVVCQDKIVVLDINASKVQIHRLRDGKFQATLDIKESNLRDMCLIDTMTICVLHDDGLIRMMSIDSTDMSRVFQTTRSLHQGLLDEYHGVVRFKDNLVVSGVRQGTMYWCIVSLDDGYFDTIHQICIGGVWSWSYMTTKDNIIYFSCNAGYESPNTGVYGFDILNPSQCKYTYKHQRLQRPTSIVINEDVNIFVCNVIPPCIHQITASCQLVAIFTHGIPWRIDAILWDHGCLYVTCLGSRDIAIFQPVYQGSHKASEVLLSDDRKQSVIEDTAIQIEQGNVPETMYPVEQIYSRISDLTAPEKSKLPLPPGKKYHVFFSYASPDIHWVKETVDTLENDHGFVCCEYDRDNTPGTHLLLFAADGIKYAIKTVVVMTKEAFKSGFVEHEIQMALQQGFETRRKCVVPVLVQDCTVPDYLRILNYVDARDSTQREIWLPKLLTELQTQAENDNALEVIGSNQRNQHLCEETSTQLEQVDSKDEEQQLYITTESGTWV